jgi:hypothetical protein
VRSGNCSGCMQRWHSSVTVPCTASSATAK